MSRKHSDDLIEFRLGALLGLEEGAPVSAEQLEEALAEARAKSEAERSPREVDLLADAALFERIVRDGLRIESERRQFRASDQRVRRTIGLLEDEPPKRTSVRRMATAALGIAAAILLLVLLPKKEALIPNLSEIPLNPPPLVRGASADTWDGIITAWDAKDFAGAAERIETALAGDPGDTTLLYHLGLVQLRRGDHERALEVLTRADELETDPPSAEIRWLRVAALDGKGERQAGCELLRQLSEGVGDRAQQAAERFAALCDEH